MDNNDMNLYWDSWDRHTIRAARCSVASEDSILLPNKDDKKSDPLAPASSVKSLPSTSPPRTPLLNRHGCGKYCGITNNSCYLLCYVLKILYFKNQNYNGLSLRCKISLKIFI